MRSRIRHVSDSVSWIDHKQRISRVEYLLRDDHIPLPEQATGVLAFLTLEHNIEPVFPVVNGPPVEFSERIVEDIGAAHMHGKVIAADSVLKLVELLSEIASLHVEVEDVRVHAGEVDENRVGLVAQVVRGLSEDVVEDCAVGESELKESLGVRRGLAADAADDGGNVTLLLLH